MGANIEIKAAVDDLNAVRWHAVKIGARYEATLRQIDIFFNVPKGRLKLRQLSPKHGELIYYERPDVAGPKHCDYVISRTAEPAILTATLAEALGIAGEVRKVRRLYLVGQTRIHLDRVEGLGDFVELEVVLKKGQKPEAGARIARDLMDKLGIANARQIKGAYIDLLRKKR